VIERFRTHPWPGNVRELKNVVERAFIMAGNEIVAENVPLSGAFVDNAAGDGGGPLQIEIGMSIAEAERRLILATLDKLEGDKKGAAETLGISLKTLYNRLKTYGPERRV
jgi:DNA-binding NtrC family response regulator